MGKHMFTEEERNELLSNPFTLCITDSGFVKFTFAFRQFVWQELQNGLKPKQIFEKAGYDYKLIGNARGQKYVYRTMDEGMSETGLIDKTPKPSNKDFSKKQTKAAIKELQDRVIYLEAQIDFLKKIAQMEKMHESKK